MDCKIFIENPDDYGGSYDFADVTTTTHYKIILRYVTVKEVFEYAIIPAPKIRLEPPSDRYRKEKEEFERSRG